MDGQIYSEYKKGNKQYEDCENAKNLKQNTRHRELKIALIISIMKLFNIVHFVDYRVIKGNLIL
jgi:hypothetical protein